jgi:hypothetical protein
MWRTIDLLPDSLSEDPQVIAACEAIDIELQEIYGEIPTINFWPHVEDQTGDMLDVMMWEMHVDIWQNWSGVLTDDDKIDLINESIDWHQHKGTPGIVEKMIDQVFGPDIAVLTEWYEYRGGGISANIPVGNPNPAPGMPVGPGWRYKFRISVGDMTAEQLDLLNRSVLAVKNLRSWPDEVARLRLTKQQSYEGQYWRHRNLTKIHMSNRISPEILGMDYFGIGTHSRHFYEIGAPTF